MTAGTQHQHSDWAQQLEQLSAYLDNEVDERERAALEQHLPTCEDCRRALAELGQSRALLRALPAPALSRSFLLPETGAVPEPLSSRGGRGSVAAPASDGHARARRARALQWIGGLVAVLGLFLLISTTLPGGVHEATSKPAASSNGGASSAPEPSSNLQTQTRVPSESASGSSSPDQVGRPTVTATPGRVISQPTAAAAATHAVSNRHASGGEHSIPLGPLAGTALLIGGTGLLVGGTILARKRSRRQAPRPRGMSPARRP